MKIILRDLLTLGIKKGAYIVHDTIDVGFISANHLFRLTEKGHREFAVLLGASVLGIQSGAYGPEITLTDIDSDIMVRLDKAAADCNSDLFTK